MSVEGVRPDPNKTAAVASISAPADEKILGHFLGLCAYYV